MSDITPEECRSTREQLAHVLDVLDPNQVFTDDMTVPTLLDYLDEAADRLDREVASDAEVEELARIAHGGYGLTSWATATPSVKASWAASAEAVRAHLADRLAPAGGMVLTADEVADVRTSDGPRERRTRQHRHRAPRRRPVPPRPKPRGGDTMSDSLFPDIDPIAAVDPYAGMGQDARRTAKQAERIAAGIHPGTHMPLHRDAATGKEGDGLRCRDCTHLYRKTGHFAGAFLKCEMTIIRADVQTSGPDMRAWWPACTRFVPREAVSS